MSTLLIYSILPVFLIGLYIYKKDKNKESSNLLKKLLLGGLYSSLITIALSFIISLFIPIFEKEFIYLEGIELICYAFIYVALIEEISKWIMLYKISYNHKEYDESYDMLLYGGFIGLGFAAIENILYVITGGLETAILRAFTAVPMHAILGVIMGYLLNKAKQNNNHKYKIISIIIPILIHGLYDYILMEGNYYYLSFIILTLSLIYAVSKLNKTNKEIINKNIKNQNQINYKEKYCPNCGTPYELKFCRNCGRERK